jgi:uncharacterized membrane protein YeaQ/YmgE (transglycosylase-associated protein family)
MTALQFGRPGAVSQVTNFSFKKSKFALNWPQSRPIPVGDASDRFWTSRLNFRRFFMGVFSWIILGLIAGYIGGKFVAKPGQGLINNLVLGIVGAVVGGLIANFFGLGGVSGVNIYSILVASGGAVVVLWLYNKFAGAN